MKCCICCHHYFNRNMHRHIHSVRGWRREEKISILFQPVSSRFKFHYQRNNLQLTNNYVYFCFELLNCGEGWRKNNEKKLIKVGQLFSDSGARLSEQWILFHLIEKYKVFFTAHLYKQKMRFYFVILIVSHLMLLRIEIRWKKVGRKKKFKFGIVPKRILKMNANATHKSSLTKTVCRCGWLMFSVRVFLKQTECARSLAHKAF